MSNELTDVRCHCGAEFPADSYDAGFIAGSGMCQNCDAAMPPKDIPALAEQAGGDERAAFEAAFAAMGRPVCRADYDQDAYGTPFDDGGWTGWQARAALAQPSPAPTLRAAIDVANDRFEVPVAKWGTDLAGEEERPEVVAFLMKPDTYEPYVDLTRDWSCDHWEALMTVTQYERITGQLHDALDESDGDRWKLRSERDAAMARVAEYEAQAQHSVPGNAAALVRAEAKKYSLNAAGMLDSGAPEHAQTFAIVQLLSEFDDEEAERHWEAIMAYSDFRTSDALFRAAELLAAAPGKEVGHE
ncbi:TPA: hypothetical protein ACXNR9_006003 [Pseudomonas aeruginosa]|nr:hypothetical protein [Pseudomonas aeruginosa]